MNIKAALPVAIVGVITFAALYFLARKKTPQGIAPADFIGPVRSGASSTAPNAISDLVDTWYI